MVRFYHISGDINPADILSKHWAHSSVYPKLLRPLLFYEGDTLELLVDEMALSPDVSAKDDGENPGRGGSSPKRHS